MREVAAHDLRLLVSRSNPNPEEQPPSRVPIQRSDLLGQDQRVTFGDYADGSAQLDLGAHGRGPRQEDQGVYDVAPEPRHRALGFDGEDVLLRRPQRLEPQRLGTLDQYGNVNRLGGGQDGETYTHDRCSGVSRMRLYSNVWRALGFPPGRGCDRTGPLWPPRFRRGTAGPSPVRRHGGGLGEGQGYSLLRPYSVLSVLSVANRTPSAQRDGSGSGNGMLTGAVARRGDNG